MEEKEREFSFGGRVQEDRVIAIGMEAASDAGMGWLFDAEPLAGEGDAAVGADAGWGAHAPDVGPPRTTGRGPQDGAILFPGQVPSGLRGGADLAVFFLSVVVEAELLDEAVGFRESGDVLGGEEGGKTSLPEVVCALDFSFGLGSGGEAQRDFVKAQGSAKLGKSLGLVGEEKGVVIDVESEGQATGSESAGEEVEMSQEALARVEACEGKKAAVIVEDLEQRRLLGLVGKPAMWRSVVLPELADLLDLPATHRLGAFFVTSIGCQVVLEGPAANGGPSELELMTAMNFRSGEAVGGRRVGLEQLAQQSQDCGGPGRKAVAAGTSGLPVPLSARGTGAQIGGVKPVEAAPTQAQFRGGFARRQGSPAETRQNITDEGRGVAAAQLLIIFSSAKDREGEPARIFY